MVKIYVKEMLLNIDLVEELQPYFGDGYKTRWTEDRLISCSPFRNESAPSFFVNLDHFDGKDIAGTWADSGAGEGDEYRSGRFEKLLAFLREEDIEDTVSYLREKYELKAYDSISIKLDLKMQEEWKPLELHGLTMAFVYLRERGISDDVIINSRTTDLGDKIALHWSDPKGNIIAIKYRMKSTKDFWYEKGGQPLNNHLYNLQRVYEKEIKTSIWITEGEIDALSVESYVSRFVGVALGNASFSDTQRDLVIRTGVPNVVVATDNDNRGKMVAARIRKMLEGYVKLWRVKLMDCKDVNDYVLKYGRLPMVEEFNHNQNVFNVPNR